LKALSQECTRSGGDVFPSTKDLESGWAAGREELPRQEEKYEHRYRFGNGYWNVPRPWEEDVMQKVN
jgi:hypothetical protein